MRREAPALRLYRGLLWLYPVEFRDHFACDMCGALADCLNARPGPVEILSLYLGVFIDAPKERYHMIRQDIVYALRTMRREKLTTLVAMLVLALGIGSTVMVFTLARSSAEFCFRLAWDCTDLSTGSIPRSAGANRTP